MIHPPQKRDQMISSKNVWRGLALSNLVLVLMLDVNLVPLATGFTTTAKSASDRGTTRTSPSISLLPRKRRCTRSEDHLSFQVFSWNVAQISRATSIQSKTLRVKSLGFLASTAGSEPAPAGYGRNDNDRRGIPGTTVISNGVTIAKKLDTTAEGTSINSSSAWDAGAPWSEFEDWLVQDTYPRYVVGSGKHVLWRRMVREVPELAGRSPSEARQRWLTLTDRLGDRDSSSASPSVETFYLQPPVLEEWEEIAEGREAGSFRGNIFGQKGLADGTSMTTAPVDMSGRRLEDQYVATECGMVYELGERRRTDLVGQVYSKVVKMSPVTALALSTAFYAAALISHHIQVEVFVI